MAKRVRLFILFLCISIVLAGCGHTPEQEPSESSAEPPIERILLATTTSTYDSGLLEYVLPAFEENHYYDVQVISMGTGQALELGKNGDVDLVLVHAKESELAMVEQGYFVNRHDVMYNDFVIVGPKDDPAALQELTDIDLAFAAMAEQQVPFVSRGDNSGTHVKELSLWEDAGFSPEGRWYIDTGSGMGEVLRMADEMLGYTLTDRATYLVMRDQLDLVILFEDDEKLFNQYGIMAVNRANYVSVNYDGALNLIDYLISPEGQEQISSYKPYGDSLFFPNAQ